MKILNSTPPKNEVVQPMCGTCEALIFINLCDVCFDYCITDCEEYCDKCAWGDIVHSIGIGN